MYDAWHTNFEKETMCKHLMSSFRSVSFLNFDTFLLLNLYWEMVPLYKNTATTNVKHNLSSFSCQPLYISVHCPHHRTQVYAGPIAMCHASVPCHIHLFQVSVCSALRRETLPSTLFIWISNLINLSKTDVRSISSGVKLGNLLMSTEAKHGSTFILSNVWNAT